MKKERPGELCRSPYISCIMSEQFTNVACTVCGCVCDDLAITVEAGRITRAERACHLAEPWFRTQNATDSEPAEVDGVPALIDQAYSRAAELLREARSPLIYGLSRSTTEGQRAATALADRLGGTIDTTASTEHAPSLLALQEVGEATCTLGEVRNRADLVIFWGSDPLTTHPRHLERYSGDAVGRWIPEGRKDRFLVVVDEVETESAKAADLFVKVELDHHWEAFNTLRMLVRGVRSAEVPNPILTSLAERMKACRCGVLFFGSAITRGTLAHHTVEALLQLVTDLNAFTRFYARRMRLYGDVAGADSVLTWQTGYPFGVNFARGYPRYNPSEFTGPDMLARGEVDVCLIVGVEPHDLPATLVANLRQIPVILLSAPGVAAAVPPAVRFTTAVYGVHRPGTAYRMDEVPVPLKVLLPTDYPSDGEVLAELLKRVM